MHGKNGLKKAISLAVVLLFLMTPVVSARSMEVKSSYSSTVTIDTAGDFYILPVHKDMEISYSIHVVNGSGVEVFLLEGKYANLTSALEAEYLVLHSSEDPTMDFSSTYTTGSDDGNYMTLLVYSDDGNSTYDISVSERELSSLEKISYTALGILVLIGIFVVPALVRRRIRKSRREKKAAELARQIQMQSTPQNPEMEPAPQDQEPPQQSNATDSNEAYRVK